MSILTDAIKMVKKSVVAIAFQEHNVFDNTNKISIVGTGFVYSKEKLLVCTCAHVIAPNGIIRNDAQLQTGVVTPTNVIGFPAKIISVDFKKDLAVLQIISTDQNVLTYLDQVKINQSLSLEEGTDVAFIGFPFGMSLSRDLVPSATRGMISAFRRNLTNGQEVELIQLDAIVGGGNSGAPVFIPDTSEVVGIIKSRFDPLMKGRPPRLIIDGEPLEIFTNIGFAQPISLVAEFLASANK